MLFQSSNRLIMLFWIVAEKCCPCAGSNLRPKNFRKKPYVTRNDLVLGQTVDCSAWSDLRSTKRRLWNFGYAGCAARGYCSIDDTRTALGSGPNRRRWCPAGISHFCRIANPPEHPISARSRGRIARSGDRGHNVPAMQSPALGTALATALKDWSSASHDERVIAHYFLFCFFKLHEQAWY